MEFIITSIISIITLITTVLIAIWQQNKARNPPSLTPQSDLPLRNDSSLLSTPFELQLQNAGLSVATNIGGILVVANVSATKAYKQFLMQGKTSLSKKDIASLHFRDTSVEMKNIKINKYTLFPPEDARFLARLTLFYDDNEEHHYISIFDYTNQHHWRQVKFLQDVGKKADPLHDLLHSSPSQSVSVTIKPSYRRDTLEAPHLEKFNGRAHELATLKQWLAVDQCRLIAILGIGGIGKTALTSRIVAEVKDEFTYIFWRSLQNAPPLKDILARCLLLLSDHQQIDIPTEEDEQISLLLRSLQEKRCLIILDNVETVLQGGNRSGYYREGYEGYGRLLQLLGETKHLGCLLLTSREKPREIIRLEGKSLPIHSLELLGVDLKDGQEILNDRGLIGSDEQIVALIRLYSGNPLALQLVAEPIQRLFGGNIAAFLRAEAPIFGDIYDLLDQQFLRLSDMERSILYWLAIDREPTSLEELSASIVEEVRKRSLLAALDSLQRRSMIEISSVGNFSLQPVISEHTTDRIIEQACEEIVSETINIIKSHAFMKAQTKDYVRDSQVRLILMPLIQRLLSNQGQENIEQKLKRILAAQRQTPPHVPSYTAGNVLNLLIKLTSKLRGYDFSHLMVSQAYLQGIALPDVNFTDSHFAKCIFTSTFGGIFSIALSPDGEILAGGTDSGDIQLWETSNGAPFSTYHEHDDWVRSVIFSPNGRILASCSDDQTIRLWDTSTGQRTAILTGHTDWVRSVVFHPDGNSIASGSNDGTIRIWDVSTGQIICVLQEHATAVLSVAFNPLGSLLATASQDQTIKLWNFASGLCIQTLTGHTGDVCSVAFDPLGRLLATASQDQTIKLWDIASGLCVQTLLGHSNGATVVAFSPDSQKVASGSQDRTIKIWDIGTGQCTGTLQGHTSPVTSLLFSQQGHTLISAGDDQTVRFWDIHSCSCVKTLQGYTNGLRSIAFMPAGNTLISGSTDPLVNIWNVQRGRVTKTLAGHTSGVRSIAISSDSQMIATGSHDRTIKLWNFNTGQCLKTLQKHTDWIWAVVFRPENQMVATGSHDQTVMLWDVHSGQYIKTLEGHTGGVRALAMSKDGQILASGGEDSTVRIWHIDDSNCITILQDHTGWIKTMAFSPSGQFLVTGSEDRTVKLWNTETWQCIQTLSGHNGWVHAVAFSPDERFLASGSTDQEIRIWECDTWQCLRTLRGHGSWVQSIAFSPDGQFLASGGNEGTIKFWNIQTGECIKTLKSGPYDGMNITHVQGLSSSQKTMLKTLGAFEDEEDGFSS